MTGPVNRLRWRCQRGMLELDHILGDFLDAGYATAPACVRDAFEALLEREDADILDLIMGRLAPDSPALADLLARLRRADPANA